MIDNLSSADFVMIWHRWVPMVAAALMILLLLYTVLQFAVAKYGGRAARFLNGGSLRMGMIVGIVLVGIVPAASLGLLLSERSAHQRQDRIAGLLEETTGSVGRVIDSFIDKHLSGISSAASAISATGNVDRTSLTQSLLLYHSTYDDFLTMLAANQQGDIVTATSNMTGFLVPVDILNGHNVSDRPYFQQPLKDGLPFISNVFQGRDLGQDPIVAVSAPLRDFDGGVVGIIEGSLNLNAFRRVDSYRPQLDGAVMILVDEEDRVIFASEAAGLTILQSIANSPLIAGSSAVSNGVSYQFVDTVQGVEHPFLGAYSTTHVGWRLYLRVPLHQITQQMLSDYKLGAWLLLAACVFSLLLAGGTVRRVTRSVDDMNRAVASFTADGSGERIRTPENTPKEFRPIFSQMRRRSRHLKNAHARLNNSIDAGDRLRKELTQAIALKEVEIAERTADLERVNEKLNDLSKVDGLTGIANRREFDLFEKRVWRLGAREQQPVAIVLMDIDYFKIYNDSLGHQAGDECLQCVAEALKNCATRPLDLVARYGGEEFVAVLSGASVEDALIVGERMREAVHTLAIPHPGSSHDVVTVSVGVASLLPDDAPDAAAVIRGADEALYYAKAAGRNCVVFRDDDEFVTYDGTEYDTGTTNVIAILSGHHPNRGRI